MEFSPGLAQAYTQGRQHYSETDTELFQHLQTIGIQGKQILDLGGGDGRYAIRLMELGAKEVTLVDVSQAMIDLAKTRVKESGLETIHIVKADARQIPLAAEMVDLLFSNFFLHYVQNTQQVAREISRLLKPGGFFIGTFNTAKVKSGHDYLYNQQMLIRLGHGEKSITVRNLIKSDEEVLMAFKKAGLHVTHFIELNHPNAVIDDAYPYKGMVQKRAMLCVAQK